MTALRRVAIGALVLLAVPAGAQMTGTVFRNYTPARLPDDSRHLTAAEGSRIVLDDYATCLVDKNQRSAVEFLKTSLAGPVTVTSTRECLQDARLEFRADSLRGAVYRALYRKNLGKASVTPAAVVVTPAAGDDAAAALEAFGACVVNADAKASQALVLSKAASAPETEAFGAIAPLLNGCMAPGATIKFNKLALTGLISEVLYTASSATRPAGMDKH
jgi:hypothetical protein